MKKSKLPKRVSRQDALEVIRKPLDPNSKTAEGILIKGEKIKSHAEQKGPTLLEIAEMQEVQRMLKRK